MPNYVTKSLHKFQHPTPRWTQYAPHQWMRPNYGATKQLKNPMDTSTPIQEERKSGVQQIVENFLYDDLDVDCTIHSDLNSIEEQQAHPTHNTEATITHFLGYSATNPTAVFQFKDSDMVLHIGSNK